MSSSNYRNTEKSFKDLVDFVLSKFMPSNFISTSVPNVLFIFVSFPEYYKILEIPVIFADFLQTEANLS